MNEAFYQFGLGTLKIKYKDEKVVRLSVVDKTTVTHNQKNKFTEKVLQEIEEYLRGERKQFSIHYEFLEGTAFQKKVWKVLETIPYGEVLTYAEVAQKIHNAKAVRAVGAACGKNPIWLIVPCHRVVGSHGQLTGYGGGIPMKKKLLEIEKKYKEVPLPVPLKSKSDTSIKEEKEDELKNKEEDNKVKKEDKVKKEKEDKIEKEDNKVKKEDKVKKEKEDKIEKEDNKVKKEDKVKKEKEDKIEKEDNKAKRRRIKR